MANMELVGKAEIVRLYTDYINNGGELSPFNTEPCRRYLQEESGEHIDSEDVLWLLYHVK